MNRAFDRPHAPQASHAEHKPVTTVSCFGAVLRHGVTVLLGLSCALSQACPALAPALQTVLPGVLVRHGMWSAQSPEGHDHRASSVVLVSKDQAVVIDPGPTALEGRALRCALNGRGIRRITRVLNSHAHAEHVLANGALGAPVAATADTQIAMRQRCSECLAALREDLGAQALRGTRTTLPTHVLREGETVHAGDRTWQVLELRAAHTESDLALWSSADGVLIAGGLLDGQGLVLAQGSVVGWLGALERLQALPVQWLIGQHLVRSGAQVPAAFEVQREALCTLVRLSWQGLEQGWSENEALSHLPVQGTRHAQRQQRFNLLRAWREMETLWLATSPMPAACRKG